MLFLKFAALLIGGGTVAGVTYTQVKKADTEKTVVVSNNQESKIRARLEKQMDKEILENKKTLTKSRKSTSDKNLTTSQSDFEEAKTNLTKAYNDLNAAKTAFNTIADDLTNKYKELKTKDDALKKALVSKMEYDLKTKETELKQEFYNAQKDTYEEEKKAIKSKIDAINSSACSGNVCDCPATLDLFSSNPKTTEEKTIETNIKQELQATCDGSVANASSLVSLTNPKDNSNYDTKKSDRDTAIDDIRKKTNAYNSQIITIKYAESEVQMKLLQFQHKEQAYLAAKINNKKIQNEIEILSEEIKNIH